MNKVLKNIYYLIVCQIIPAIITYFAYKATGSGWSIMLLPVLIAAATILVFRKKII